MQKPSVRVARAALRGRRFTPATIAAVLDLVLVPELSYGAAARIHGVDVSRVHRAAAVVPGLADMRRRKGGRSDASA